MVVAVTATLSPFPKDVKLVRDDFHDCVIAQTDVRTLAQLSPASASVRRLRDFMRDADIGSGVSASASGGDADDVDIGSVDRVLQVEDVWKMAEEMATAPHGKKRVDRRSTLSLSLSLDWSNLMFIYGLLILDLLSSAPGSFRRVKSCSRHPPVMTRHREALLILLSQTRYFRSVISPILPCLPLPPSSPKLLSQTPHFRPVSSSFTAF